MIIYGDLSQQSIKNTILVNTFLGSGFAWVESLVKHWAKEEIEANCLLKLIFIVVAMLILFGAWVILFPDWLSKFKWFKSFFGEIKISPEAFFIFTIIFWLTNRGIDYWDIVNKINK